MSESKPNISDILTTFQNVKDQSTVNILSCCKSPKKEKKVKSSQTVELLLKVALRVMYGITIELKPRDSKLLLTKEGKKSKSICVISKLFATSGLIKLADYQRKVMI